MDQVDQGSAAIHVKLSYLTSSVDELKDGLGEVNSSLKTLIRVEERQISQEEILHSLDTRVGDHEKRLQVVEHHVPSLRETRSWVVAAVLLLCVAGAGALTSGWVQIRGPVEMARGK